MSKSVKLPSDIYISEQSVGKSLYYNYNGTNQDFVLSDNYTKFKKIDIVYGYSTWGQMNYIHSFLPERTSTPCLTAIYTFSNATMRFATCGLTFNNKNVRIQTDRCAVMDMTSNGVNQFNGNNNILVYEVIGYPN